MPFAYRVRQFFSALTARVAAEERATPARYLSGEQLALFLAMPINDQRHALNVLYRLLAAGHDHPHLLQAALLHDAGKAQGRLGLATRVAVVLLRRIDGRIVDQLANAGGARWRRALYVHAHHAAIGAELAAAAGSPAPVVRLIRGHGRAGACRAGDDLARALHAADEES